MSLEAMTWVINNSPYKGTKLLIHLMMADVVNSDHGHLFYMRQTKLARKARTSRKTVSETIQMMMDDGCLRMHRDRTGSGKDDANVYQFLMPDVERFFDSRTKSGVPNDLPETEDGTYAAAYRKNARKRRAEADMARAGAPTIPGLLGDDVDTDGDADELGDAHEAARSTDAGGTVEPFAIDEPDEVLDDDEDEDFDDAVESYSGESDLPTDDGVTSGDTIVAKVVSGPFDEAATEGVTSGDTNVETAANSNGVTSGDPNIGVTSGDTRCHDSLHPGVTSGDTHIRNNPRGTPTVNPIFRGPADAAPQDDRRVQASSLFLHGSDLAVVDLRDSDQQAAQVGRREGVTMQANDHHGSAVTPTAADQDQMRAAAASLVLGLAPADTGPVTAEPAGRLTDGPDDGLAPTLAQAKAMTLPERLARMPEHPLVDAPAKVRKDWATEVHRYFLDWRTENAAGPLNKTWIAVIRKFVGVIIEQGFAPRAALTVVFTWANARRPDGAMYHPAAIQTFANSAAQNGGAVHGADGVGTSTRHVAVSDGVDALASFVRQLPNAAG